MKKLHIKNIKKLTFDKIKFMIDYERYIEIDEDV